jgi:hypothetical protein
VRHTGTWHHRDVVFGLIGRLAPGNVEGIVRGLCTRQRRSLHVHAAVPVEGRAIGVTQVQAMLAGQAIDVGELAPYFDTAGTACAVCLTLPMQLSTPWCILVLPPLPDIIPNSKSSYLRSTWLANAQHLKRQERDHQQPPSPYCPRNHATPPQHGSEEHHHRPAPQPSRG